jgi:hypothetical protein
MSLPKNLNVFDTYWAKDLAKRYSLQCNVIDVPGQIMIQSSKISAELKQREPWSTALESQIYTYYDMLMAHCIGKIDEPVIIGDQLNFRRDVDPGSAWCLILDENSYFWPSRYCSIHPDKTIISNFFTRSSEIVYSFINDASVRDVTSDTGNGKITLVSSRQQIFGSQGFHKRGPSQRTISNINIPGLHETNSDWLQDTLGFHNRYFYLDINKFTNSVEEKSTVWSYV